MRFLTLTKHSGPKTRYSDNAVNIQIVLILYLNWFSNPMINTIPSADYLTATTRKNSIDVNSIAVLI